MLEEPMNNLQKNALMLGLAYLNSGINVTKTKNGTEEESAIYTIESDDGKINFTVHVDELDRDCEEDLRKFVEYSFERNAFVMEEMNDEEDIVENIAKLCNGIAYNLAKEEEEARIVAIEGDYVNTDSQRAYLRRRTALSEFIYGKDAKISRLEYTTLISARYFIDNTYGKDIFLSGEDVLDFINITNVISNVFPFLEEGEAPFFELCKNALDEDEAYEC